MRTIERINQIILDLDNSFEIREFRLSDGFIIWFQVRYKIFRFLMKNLEINDELKSSNYSKLNYLASFKTRFYYYFQIIRKQAILLHGKYDGLVFSSTMGSFKAEKNEYQSRTNQFLNHNKNVLNLFFSTNGKLNLPYSKPFALADSINIYNSVICKVFRIKTLPIDIQNIDFFITFIQKNLKPKLTNQQLNNLKFELITFAKIYYLNKRTISSIFQRTQPNFIVVEDANYGGGLSTQIVYIANQNKIKTIEVQHGILDIGYLYGQKLQNLDTFNLYKTNYLLTYGEFWNRKISSNTKGFDIGYPFLEEKRKFLKEIGTNDILFVSQGSITDFLIEMAFVISQKLNNNYKIIFRLHPNENKMDSKYDRLKSQTNISFSNSGDIYQELLSCKSIVGSYSAVIFEATLFNKPIFIHKNELSDEYIPMEIGKRFTNTEELLELLINETGQNNNYGAFWTIGWKKRVNEFYKEAGLN